MRFRSCALAIVFVSACGGSSDPAASHDGATDVGLDAPMDDGTPESAVDVGSDALDDASVDSDRCGTPTTTWSSCSANPVAQAGFLQPDGRYELSIGDPDVQFDPATKLWRAWWSTGLAKRYADPPQLGIKYAESNDGVAWTIQPAPAILASTDPADWDASKLETPTVLLVPTNPAASRYLLYYSGAPVAEKTINGASIPWYQIGLATSPDGKTFTRIPASASPYGKAGLVLQGIDAFPGLAGVVDGLVADPEIVFDGTTFHLFFSSAAVDGSRAALAFGVAHATSTDGIHWTATAGNPIATLNGSKGPSIVRDASGHWEMFFQRDTDADLASVPSTFNPQLGIWRSTSTDLATWTAPGTTRELTWDGTDPLQKYGWIAVGDMTLVNGEHRYYVPAFSALSPPDSGWVVPTKGGFLASRIVLDLFRRR